MTNDTLVIAADKQINLLNELMNKISLSIKVYKQQEMNFNIKMSMIEGNISENYNKSINNKTKSNQNNISTISNHDHSNNNSNSKQ